MLSAIVLTRNEERNIEHCLASLSWADELLVVDSGSTDATVALAQKYGATILEHPFTDFASQRNFAMQQAKGDWVLFLDADERITLELEEEIRRVISQETKTIPACVYAIPRHTYFFGKRLRFSDARHDAPIRLFPKRDVCWTQPVHETITTALPCRRLQNPMLHYSTRDYDHYRQKVREYVPLELITMREKGVRPTFFHVLWRPIAKFFYLYFWRLGILDGVTGLQYAILSAYYTLVKYWRYFNS